MRVTLPSIRGYVLRGEGDNDRIVRHVSLLFGAGERGGGGFGARLYGNKQSL